jgi:hypothetical protein
MTAAAIYDSTEAPGTETNTPAPAYDTLTLGLSEDSLRPGQNVQFLAYLDGQKLSAPQEVDLQHSLGNIESFTFNGYWGPGPHDLQIDMIGPAHHRAIGNLYVDTVEYNGAKYSIGTEIHRHGTFDYIIGAPSN